MFQRKKNTEYTQEIMVTSCKKQAQFIVSSVEGKSLKLDPKVTILSLKSAHFIFKLKPNK